MDLYWEVSREGAVIAILMHRDSLLGFVDELDITVLGLVTSSFATSVFCG